MSMSGAVEQFVKYRIKSIENMADSSRQKAMLAELRRGIGRKPGDIPKLWGVLFEGMPEEMMSKSGEPTSAEWAGYLALTLYAYHQQGKNPKTDSMNLEKRGIGTAVGMLVENEYDLQRVQNRFNRFATASDMEEASVHLRSLVGLLRAKDIGLDYGLLAENLYRYQFYESAKSVRLIWGQDFYRQISKKKNVQEEEKQ